MASLNLNLSIIGKSGKEYLFTLYSTEHAFSLKKGGVYLFSKRTLKENKGTHTVLYYGKANVFNERLDNHEKWEKALKSGCNCIGILETDSEEKSLEIEKDILLNNNTPLNVQNNS